MVSGILKKKYLNFHNSGKSAKSFYNSDVQKQGRGLCRSNGGLLGFVRIVLDPDGIPNTIEQLAWRRFTSINRTYDGLIFKDRLGNVTLHTY